MHTLTLTLDESRWSALEAIAREQGAGTVENFVTRRLDELIATRQPLAPEVNDHLQSSIRENLGLLKRLAE